LNKINKKETKMTRREFRRAINILVINGTIKNLEEFAKLFHLANKLSRQTQKLMV
jgi:hypothetical protein